MNRFYETFSNRLLHVCLVLRWLFPKFSQTNKQFLEEFELLSLPVTRYAPQTYDAVWAIALALLGAQQKWETAKLPMSLHHFDYSRSDMREEFLSQLGQLKFLGVSVSSVKSSTLHWVIHYLVKRKFNSCRFWYSSCWKTSECLLIIISFSFCLRDPCHSVGLIVLESLLSIKSKVGTAWH